MSHRHIRLLSAPRMHAGKTLFFFYFIKCITANTTTAGQLAQKQAVAACRDLTSSTTNDGTTLTVSQFPDPSCWDTLDMTDWMTKWNATTTTCTVPESNLASCQCQIDEPWATCFMRLTYATNKTAGYACMDLTNPGSCTLPVPGNIVQGPAEIFYGAASVRQPIM